MELSNNQKDLPISILKSMYTLMLKIRLFEEFISELIMHDEIICPCHLYIGQEAIATGVCAAVKESDWVFSTHRSHGHFIAKGGNIQELMAEMLGKITGCSSGKGGSMHISAPNLGLPGSSAIVAGTIPIAVGSALAFSLKGSDSVCIAFFGDGATNEGVFYESLNLAALLKLPIIFVCENNLYSTHMSISRCLADTDILKKVKAFGVNGTRIDGNNIFEVYNAAVQAVQIARRGYGPYFIECMTYRWRGHVGPSDDIEKGLRSVDELNFWQDKCPINLLENYLIENDYMLKDELLKIQESITREIKSAYDYAKRSAYPSMDSLMRDIFM